LGVGLASDCTALAVDGGSLIATRPVFAGKAVQKMRFPRTPALASLRPKLFAPVAGAGKAGAVQPLEVAVAPPRARVREVAAEKGGKVDLTESEIIVSGGRGLKGPEHFKLIEELAAA